MPTSDENHEIVRAIRSRAQELAVSGGLLDHTTTEAEVLACLADGKLSFEDLDDDALERCVHTFGTDYVIDALVAGDSQTAKAGRPRQSLPAEAPLRPPVSKAPLARRRGVWQLFAFSWLRSPIWIAAAATIGIVATVAYVALMRSSGERVPPSAAVNLALQWPSRAPFDPATLKRWGSQPTLLPRGMPNFVNSVATLGAGGDDRFTHWRLATAIVRSKSGWGSGAFISPDGWLLTNYHVVATAAQDAALNGDTATLDVITGWLADGRMKPRPSLKATLYRVDPILDLALLKVDALPSGIRQMPYFQLGTQVRDGEDCFVIGSQNNGPAWWVRSGNVSQEFDFPDDLSQFAAGVASTGADVERSHATVIVTDTRVSSGDSGGPLLNAKGELIGLTFATPGNLSAGSVGWHVALPHLRHFVADLPSAPEGVPFDVWTAGLPDAIMLEPELNGGARDADIHLLRYRYASRPGENAATESPQPVALTVFVDFSRRAQENNGKLDRVPFGLWGMDTRGRFRFDLFLMTRADGVMVTGYSNREHIVDDIRIGRSRQDAAVIMWRRDETGKWHATKPSIPTALIDSTRLGLTNLNRLQAITGQIMRVSAPAQQSDERDRRGPNKQ